MPQPEPRASGAQKAFILKQGAEPIPVAKICRRAGISQATHFNWKKKCDGLLQADIRRLKQLEDENAKLHSSFPISRWTARCFRGNVT